MSRPANPVTLPLAQYSPKHFLLAVTDGVATVTLNRPERKNPLTFESYRELTDFFRACAMDEEVKTIVVSGAGGNFSSGGDVFEIIGPLVQMDTKGLTAFTRMTGDLVKAMRACPQPIVAAVDGICAGAGAIVAMASDMRLGTARSKTAFLFNRVGLAGCDMGACAMLPRIIGQGRASELLYTGRDRKSTRLNSSHGYISYAVFCLKKKKTATAAPTGPSLAGATHARSPASPPRRAD